MTVSGPQQVPFNGIGQNTGFNYNLWSPKGSLYFFFFDFFNLILFISGE